MSEPTSHDRPLVSVVVPARNEQHHLGPCIDSVLAQTYPPDRWELLVVENGSTDATPAVARTYAEHDPRVRLIVSSASHQAGAMNEGVLQARGEIVVRVDAHGLLAPDYLEEVVAAFRRHPDAVAVGGPYRPLTDTLLERVVGMARSTRLGVGSGWGSADPTREHAVRTVGCPSYRRAALLDVCLFDDAMLYAEDDELNWRLVSRGGAIYYCPALKQLNRPRGSLRSLARQYWNYGHGRFRLLLKDRTYLQAKHVVPTIFALGVVAAPVLAWTLPFTRLPLAALAAAYLCLLAVVALQGLRCGWREALLLPVAVSAMHFGYGLGFASAAVRHALGGRSAPQRHPFPRPSSAEQP